MATQYDTLARLSKSRRNICISPQSFDTVAAQEFQAANWEEERNPGLRTAGAAKLREEHPSGRRPQTGESHSLLIQL